MEIQKSTGYAIRILNYLHNHHFGGEAPTAQFVSEALGMSYPSFIRVASQLKQGGLLTSVQGRHGGYQIAKSGDEISMYDVLRAIEGELHISPCLKKGYQNGKNAQCTIHDYFKTVQEELVRVMSDKKISDFGCKHDLCTTKRRA